MSKFKSLLKINPLVYLVPAGAIGLIFLFFYNPQDISVFPSCPFFVLTGYKCPGCGTLRAIHAMLHLRFLDALKLNPLMVVSIPVLLAMVVSRKFAFNATMAKIVAVVTIAYWILRNVVERCCC